MTSVITSLLLGVSNNHQNFIFGLGFDNSSYSESNHSNFFQANATMKPKLGFGLNQAFIFEME